MDHLDDLERAFGGDEIHDRISASDADPVAMLDLDSAEVVGVPSVHREGNVVFYERDVRIERIAGTIAVERVCFATRVHEPALDPVIQAMLDHDVM